MIFPVYFVIPQNLNIHIISSSHKIFPFVYLIIHSNLAPSMQINQPHTGRTSFPEYPVEAQNQPALLPLSLSGGAPLNRKGIDPHNVSGYIYCPYIHFSICLSFPEKFIKIYVFPAIPLSVKMLFCQKRASAVTWTADALFHKLLYYVIISSCEESGQTTVSPSQLQLSHDGSAWISAINVKLPFC